MLFKRYEDLESIEDSLQNIIDLQDFIDSDVLFKNKEQIRSRLSCSQLILSINEQEVLSIIINDGLDLLVNKNYKEDINVVSLLDFWKNELQILVEEHKEQTQRNIDFINSLN